MGLRHILEPSQLSSALPPPSSLEMLKVGLWLWLFPLEPSTPVGTSSQHSSAGTSQSLPRPEATGLLTTTSINWLSRGKSGALQRLRVQGQKGPFDHILTPVQHRPVTPVLGPAASRAGQPLPFLGSVKRPTSDLNVSGLHCQLPSTALRSHLPPPGLQADTSADRIALRRTPPRGDTHPTTSCRANPKPHQGPASNDWATSHPGHMLHLLPDFPGTPSWPLRSVSQPPKITWTLTSQLCPGAATSIPTSSPEQSLPRPHGNLPKPSGHKGSRAGAPSHPPPLHHQRSSSSPTAPPQCSQRMGDACPPLGQQQC